MKGEIGRKVTDLRALTFLLLRLRRRTRFFLHLALIFDNKFGTGNRIQMLAIEKIDRMVEGCST